MDILLVNDDGIDSRRLAFARKELEKYGNVIVVAPKSQQSGKSTAISIQGFPFEKIDKRTYVVNGTPADCVTFGLLALEFKPDLVVSGVNEGYNTGVDTMYSGTVGAAFQAYYHGYKAIAFSADPKGIKNMKKCFSKTLDYIIDERLLSNDHILNVNFPKEHVDEIEGNKITKTYFLSYDVEKTVESNFFSTKREVLSDEAPLDSDIYAIETGYVSISKLQVGEKR